MEMNFLLWYAARGLRGRTTGLTASARQLRRHPCTGQAAESRTVAWGIEMARVSGGNGETEGRRYLGWKMERKVVGVMGVARVD